MPVVGTNIPDENNDVVFEMCPHANKFAERKLEELKKCMQQLQYWGLKPTQVLCDIFSCFDVVK